MGISSTRPTRPAGPGGTSRSVGSGCTFAARAAAAAVAAAVLAGCGTAAAEHAPVTRRPAATAAATAATGAVGYAAEYATDRYRLSMVAAAESFTSDARALAAAAERGDLARAEADEVAAQGEVDALRETLGQYLGVARDLSGPPAGPGAGVAPSGLELVARDLWRDHGRGAAAAARALATQGPSIELLLTTFSPSPSTIAAYGVDALDFVNDVAVRGAEEPYSHLDTADVIASVAAARAAYAQLVPLGDLVDGVATAAVGDDFTDLGRVVAGLGPAGSRPDASVAPARWRAIAQQVDVTAGALAELGPELPSATPGNLDYARGKQTP